MTHTPSPLPWSVSGFTIVDANGAIVADFDVLPPLEDGTALANLALVVSAVNANRVAP